MKKALLVFGLSFVLFACQDGGGIGGSKEYCWECNVSTVVSAPGIPTQTSTSTIQQCDLTEEEASNYEKAGTNTATSSAGGITATAKTTTKCIKK